MSTLKYNDGATQFRLRLACAILSHRPLLLRNIRPDDLSSPGLREHEISFLRLLDTLTNGTTIEINTTDDLSSPGLREHEISFLRLLDTLTNGTTIEINTTGTQLRFVPGVLLGCDGGEHLCPKSRGVGYFMEGILPLVMFGKGSFEMTFRGVTEGCTQDMTVDYISSSVLPLLSKFGVGANEDFGGAPHLKIHKRAAAPKVNVPNANDNQDLGAVTLYCPQLTTLSIIDFVDPGFVKRIRGVSSSTKLNPTSSSRASHAAQLTTLSIIDFVDPGFVKRIRGVSSSTKLNPTSSSRASHAAKGVLHKLLPDVWIHTDAAKKGGSSKNGGVTPSLSVTLWAESTTGVVLSHPSLSLNTGPSKSKSGKPELPEDLGQRAALHLLHEVQCGGCVDTTAQSLVLLLMCLTPEDVSRVRLGTLSPYSVLALRLFKEVFQVEFQITTNQNKNSGDDTEETDKTILMSCLGSGYRNMTKAST
eukprot:CAMPEP_0194447050 /NCGR_PEP_ID=MMETSP0176-20130528/128785_1 /TAXON_ID=216777 /ORGANISM="Proboscia alata, Strain PI-D3" /LENGTH=474 /DNA_ID=CAMNT_0039273855 /DNA_START=195 /DNA_END=1620 /DNA_ORIENTATION=-